METGDGSDGLERRPCEARAVAQKALRRRAGEGWYWTMPATEKGMLDHAYCGPRGELGGVCGVCAEGELNLFVSIIPSQSLASFLRKDVCDDSFG